MNLSRYVGCALIVFFALSIGCRKKQDPLVIHVFYDPAGAFAKSPLHEKLLRYNFVDHKTVKGQATMVAWLSTADYHKTLTTVIPRAKPDLLIFNSLDEATSLGTSVDIRDAVNLCRPTGTCLAVIPAWVDEEERRATIDFLDYLQTD